MFSVGDYEEIINKFVKERSTLPVMFISTPVDRFSQMFTKRCPTTHILTRIATLANESLSSLLNQLENFEMKIDTKVFNCFSVASLNLEKCIISVC